MKHIHHIIPKHAGGTDEESNLVELTIEEHAEAHKKLYEEYGKWEDFLAWQGLAGLKSKEELVKELLSQAGKKGGASRSKEDNIRIAKIAARANWNKNSKKIKEVLRKNSEKNRKLKEETGRGIGGTPKDKYMWITNGIENKKISKEENIPPMWYKGRQKTWKSSSSSKPKEIVSCPHCDTSGGKPVMMRYHFNNCKKKETTNDFKKFRN